MPLSSNLFSYLFLSSSLLLFFFYFSFSFLLTQHNRRIVDMYINRSPELKSYWWAYRIGRPPSSVCPSFVCRPHSLNIFSSETLGQSKSNFIWSLHGMGERKFVQMKQVTWTSWPPYPYMVKTLKNHLLRNQKADDIETWCAALSAWVLPSLYKWWPWVDLDLFYGKVKFPPLCFCMGKR